MMPSTHKAVLYSTSNVLWTWPLPELSSLDYALMWASLIEEAYKMSTKTGGGKIVMLYLFSDIYSFSLSGDVVYLW